MKSIMLCFLFVFALMNGPVQASSLENSDSFLTSEDVETYYKQGYIIKRGCFTPAEIQEMDEKSRELIQVIFNELSQDTYAFSNKIQEMYLSKSKVDFRKQEGKDIAIFKVVGCGDVEPRFGELLTSTKMVNAFFQLLQCDQLEQLICQFHPKLPKDGIAFNKHRDVTFRRAMDPNWQDIQGNGSYAIAAVAIDPMSPNNGGLFIDRSTYPKDKESQEEDIIGVELNPGDMLFMHPEILHWSTENTSNMSRRSLLAGFCVFGANHENYPGDHTNNHFSKQPDGIEVKPSPWKKVSY